MERLERAYSIASSCLSETAPCFTAPATASSFCAAGCSPWAPAVLTTYTHCSHLDVVHPCSLKTFLTPRDYVSWEKLSTSLLQWRFRGTDETPSQASPASHPHLPALCGPSRPGLVVGSQGWSSLHSPLANLLGPRGWHLGSPLFRDTSSL